MDVTRMRILIVEDEAAHVEAIRRAFEAAGTEAGMQVTGTLREYRESVAARAPDIALVDLNLPDGRAVEVLTSPPEAGPFPILIMTAYGTEQVAVEAMRSGALDYIVKSSETFADMPRTVARALREWNALQERKRAEETLGYHLEFEKLVASISTQFIGTTADDVPSRMSDTLRRIAQFASADRSYVLLFSADRTQIDDVCEWCAEEIEPHVHTLKGSPVGALPWVAEGMKQSQTLCIRRVADLPHEAGAEKEHFQKGAA
ncbi:MAG: response regulator, partial [Candidatus Sumerlaeota bacterium]|nr:response regulator [Candidatus Sumerlaeota bacterium]